MFFITKIFNTDLTHNCQENAAMNCQTTNEQVVKLKHNVLIDPELEELQLAAR